MTHDDIDPLRDKLKGLDWVADADVRLREQGQVYFGEAFVVPSDTSGLTAKLEDVLGEVRGLDWRLYDLDAPMFVKWARGAISSFPKHLRGVGQDLPISRDELGPGGDGRPVDLPAM